jgi:predicted phosphate transport protein (TIGR00153 family)
MKENPMVKLTSIFVKSPFKRMREHMLKVIECVVLLNEFFDALHSQNHIRIDELQEKVHKAENEADEIKNEMRDHLPRSVFMPINRRDLLDMLDLQDSIADTAEDIVDLLTLRKMFPPKELHQKLAQYLEVAQETCFMARDISADFDILLETGFGQKEAERILEMIEKVSDKETLVDKTGIELTQELFALEKQMNPIDVIFWHKIFELIGGLADYAEKVSNRFRLLIAQS